MNTKRRHKVYALFLSVALMFTMGFGTTMQSAYATEAEPPAQETQSTEPNDELYETTKAKDVEEEEVGDSIFEGEYSNKDLLSYNFLYIQKNADSKYVNVDGIVLESFAEPVALAKGVATYNEKVQKDFDVTKNGYIAGMTYEIPIYNVDKDSDYYVAIPDVNLGNSKFEQYDFMMSYNNEQAEMIENYHYDANTSIAYVPKSVVDNPNNKEELVEGDFAPIAMQMNYCIKNIKSDKDGNEIYSKDIPISILSNDAPEYKSVKANSLFESYVSVNTGVKGANGVSVFLNGSLFPVKDDAFVYDKTTGEVVISISPAVVSNINIVADMPTKGEKAKGFIASKVIPRVFASVSDDTKKSQEDMKTYKTSKGKFVTITFSKDMYVGWRGYYNSGTIVHSNDTSTLTGLKGFSNSLKYLYGGYMPGDGLDPNVTTQKQEPLWAISSYTLGVDVMNGNGLTQGEKIQRSNDPSGTKKTIYEWMMSYRNSLEKSDVNAIGTSGTGGPDVTPGANGLGGRNNFAIKFPSTIKGSDTNLISDSDNPGYGKTQKNLTVNAEGIDDSTYLAASCTHLGEEVNASDADGQKTVYVSCIGMDDGYVVLAFTTANRDGGDEGQNATAIYKFRTGVPIKLKKVSSNKSITDGNAQYSLAGAVYGLYDSEADANSDTDRIATFTTKANGESNEESVPTGKLWVKEITRSTGYQRTPNAFPITVKSSTDVQTFDTAENPKWGEFDLQKYDIETGAPVPLGGASFEGAEFEVKYTDGGSVNRTWQIKTDANGHAKLDENAKGDTLFKNSAGKVVVPLGTVTVKETKAPEGYQKCEDTFTVQVTDNTADDVEMVNTKLKTVAKSDKYPTKYTVAVPEQVFRGDVSWGKIVERTNAKLEYVPFTIKSMTTGETHVVVANKNGLINTKAERPFPMHTANTNGSDSLINENGEPNLNSEGMVETTAEMSKNGTWFYRDKASNEAREVNDDLGALPYDTYVITELPYELNKGYDLVKDREFTIEDDNYVVPIGDITNLKETPIDIGTTAKDKKTQSHITKAEETATVIDTVKYVNLTVGEEYTVTGYPINKETGEPIEGVTAQTTFTPKSANGEVELAFTFNSKELEGKTIVFFESLYLGTEITGEPVAKHEDPDDPDQTIYIPEVKTTATDKASGTHNANAATDVTIVDKVMYKNLIPGEEYTVKGELMYKDGKSTKLTAEKTFTPNEPDGTVELEFRFNASKVGGSSLVVFETLYDTNGKIVGEHKDPNDPEQTVNYPRIGTTAVDKATDAHVGNAGKKTVIVDTVKYENLVPGRTYTLEGELMDRETDKSTGATASTKFTPEKASGEVKLEFTVDTSKLKGHTLVAFETLKMASESKDEEGNIVEDPNKPVVVAEHKDINDEAQSVHIPKVRTKAADKKTQKKTITSGVVVDVVKYTNLIPGKKYTVEGELMNKDGGKSTGIKASKEFTPSKPNGEVKLEFKIDSKWKGKNLVAFETLKFKGKIIGEHKDINDPEQTVKIGTPTPNNPGSPKTGQSIPWILGGLIAIFALAGVYVARNRKELFNK